MDTRKCTKTSFWKDSELRCFECFTNVLGNIQSLLNRDWTARNALGERLPFDKFKYEKPGTVCPLEIVNRSDIGMVKRGENFGFSLKSAHPICVTRELIGQNFDGHVAFELGVTGAIDLAHPALT